MAEGSEQARPARIWVPTPVAYAHYAAWEAAADAAVEEARVLLGEACGPLHDGLERLVTIRANLSAGGRLDVVAGDLRGLAALMEECFGTVPNALEAAAVRLTTGVTEGAEVGAWVRLLAAQRALAGPSLGAWQRGLRGAA